jgi:DeoR/GlpR family transcriptional regulator of sugar metabolism|tara:strand:+ start:39 stop:311 length:273 start_codon:yes stop_codon:yes gene_type:complete
MEDRFNDYIEGLETHRWVGVTDLSEQFDISERTIYQWLKDKKIEGVKWKNRRLINVPSVFGYLLKKKVIEVSQIKQQELKRELELKEFQK